MDAAFVLGRDASLGSIEPGKLADFVILGQDPHAIDPFALKDIPIIRTVVGGKTMYEA